MGFDLSAGSSVSGQRHLEALKPSQSSSSLDPKSSIDERLRAKEEKVPPAISVLTSSEVREVRERFEPLAPVLKSALRGSQNLGRELRALQETALKQAPSLPSEGIPLVPAEPLSEPTPVLSKDGTFLPNPGSGEGLTPSVSGEKIQHPILPPSVEPRPPQGIPVSGGLAVVLPGQSRPAPTPDPLFGVQEGESVRVGAQGEGVSRVGEGGFDPKDLQRLLRALEPGHLLVLTQEALDSFDRPAFGPVGVEFALQQKGFRQEEAQTFLGIQEGENVAKNTVGGDNVPEPKAPEGSKGTEGAPERRSEGTVGAPPEPPLSNINRFEPPLPTNVRSRFVPVVTVNLLDLVL